MPTSQKFRTDQRTDQRRKKGKWNTPKWQGNEVTENDDLPRAGRPSACSLGTITTTTTSQWWINHTKEKKIYGSRQQQIEWMTYPFAQPLFDIVAFTDVRIDFANVGHIFSSFLALFLSFLACSQTTQISNLCQPESSMRGATRSASVQTVDKRGAGLSSTWWFTR